MSQIKLVTSLLDLDKSELLYDFKTFRPDDWTITRHTPSWQVSSDAIIGGKPDEENHGQIFFKDWVAGDIVLEFDAELLGNSYHDLCWWWSTSLDQDPWGEGYLGCIGGWWNNLAGIEKSPTFEPACIIPACPVQPRTKYHIVSGSSGSLQFIAVNGEMICYMRDPLVLKGGHFGFGVFQSHARYSNLKVYRPHVTGIPVGYKKDSEMSL